MKGKHHVLLGFALMICLMLSGCLTLLDEREPRDEGNPVEQTTERVRPTVQLDEGYYAGLAPLQESPTRFLLAEELASYRLDRDRFELSLLQTAARYFSTDEHLFVGGQLISAAEGRRWLKRESTDEPEGLNPADAPSAVLRHILEHNYYALNGQDLSGVTIGLALASTYVEVREDGEQTLYYTADQLRSYGYAMADEIVTRLRNKGVNVPIVVALYQLEEAGSYRPGNLLSVGISEAEENSIGGWETIEEVYMLFPSDGLERLDKEVAATYDQLLDKVNQYFPRYVGMVGLGRFVEEQLLELELNVTTEFASIAEVIQLTQYIGAEAIELFPDYVNISIHLGTINEPKAIFTRQPEQEPLMHYYR